MIHQKCLVVCFQAGSVLWFAFAQFFLISHIDSNFKPIPTIVPSLRDENLGIMGTLPYINIHSNAIDVSCLQAKCNSVFAIISKLKQADRNYGPV